MQSRFPNPVILACLIVLIGSFSPDCPASDLKDPQYWEKESQAALTEFQSGNFRQAESMYRKLAETGALLNGDDPRYPLVLGRLAGALNKLGKYDEAAKLGEKALELRTRQAGADHYDIALISRRLAASYYYQHRWKDAEKLMSRDLELTKMKFGPDSPMAARCMFNLGTMLNALEKFPEAIKLLNKAYRIQRKVLPENDMESLRTLSALGMAETGDSAEWMNALNNTATSLDLARKQLGSQNPELSDFLVHSAEALTKQHGYCLASDRLKEAIKLKEKAIGKQHPDLLPLLERYEYVLENICKKRAAGRVKRKADKIWNKMGKK